MNALDGISPRRLRWRLRGAWQWPAFAVLTVADALILHLLPPARTGIDLPLGLIVASFGNLFLVGAVAPWIARRLVQRGGGGSLPGDSLPPEVVLDRTATALLVAGALGIVAAGLAARPVVVLETEAREENAQLVTDYVAAHGSAELKRNVENANTIRLGEGYFRTCIALDDRRRHFCLFVDTDRHTLRRDSSMVPNAELEGGG